MKTNNRISLNVLLVGLGCFLFTIDSSRGMFGEGFEGDQKAKQKAEQNQRARDLTAPDNNNLRDNGSSDLTRTELARIFHRRQKK